MAGSPLVGGGKDAEFCLEVAGEIFGVVETYLVGDLGNGELVLFQQLGSSFQADGPDEFNRGLAGEVEEFFIEGYPAQE